MAITQVTNSTSFSNWKDITNAIIAALGDNSNLNTTQKLTLVAAINELVSKLGDLTTLSTTNKSTVVGAINENVTNRGNITTLTTTTKSSTVAAINELVSIIGSLNSLTTSNRTNLVNAINEIDSFSETISNNIGDNIDLNTQDTTTFVSAINELVGVIGALGSLTTTDKDSIVNAINEVDSNIDNAFDHIGDKDTLTTTTKLNLVAALNELVSSIGTLTLLSTTQKSSLVGAINEVNGAQVKRHHIPVENLEINHGRFSTETTRVLTTFDDTQSKCIKPFNGSTLSEGDRFIDDNGDHGGANGNLGADMSALMTEIFNAGRTDNKNGYEFYIMNITAGGGTGNTEIFDSINYYPMVSTNDDILGQIGETLTFQCWIRLKTLADSADNGVLLGDSSVTNYINGVQVSSPRLLTLGEGWVHLRQTCTLTNEFKQFMPVIMGNIGDVVQIALPAIYNADIDNGIHLGVM